MSGVRCARHERLRPKGAARGASAEARGLSRALLAPPLGPGLGTPWPHGPVATWGASRAPLQAVLP
eukprot:7289764-Pyramimonas_sp.AAC.1